MKAGGIAAAAAATLPGLVPGLANAALLGPARYKTKHVVLVALAGGVRSQETLFTPSNVPNLMQLGGEGVIVPSVGVRNVGHYGALLSLFTGRFEVMGIRENERGYDPTIFEYVRKHAGLKASDVWLSASGGPQQRNLAYSLHKDYGAAFGANLISADGVFNAEFKDLLASFGRPAAPDASEDALITKLRASIDPEAVRRLGAAGVASDPESTARLEKLILDELTGRGPEITGPASGDARAMRTAINVLQVFRPSLLGVALTNADVAHGSFNGYVDVIRRNDGEIGNLMRAIRADRALRDTTTVIVLPEFGRDRALNERNGLDHGDNSDELRRVSMFAWGPDFKKGATVKKTIESIDVCPTICQFFSVKPEHAEAKVARELFA
jgi:hypothetical protein